jgi:hypothetical protein
LEHDLDADSTSKRKGKGKARGKGKGKAKDLDREPFDPESVEYTDFVPDSVAKSTLYLDYVSPRTTFAPLPFRFPL